MSTEAILRNRVQSHPNDHAAWHELGLVYFNVGNLLLAVQCIEAAIALKGKVVLYQRNIGEMYRRMGQLDKAITAGRRAVKLAPGDIDAHYNLGLAHTDAKNYSKAIDCYRRALQLNPQHNLSWNNLGSALEQQGDKDGALKAYEKAVAIDMRHAEAQNNAGAIYSEQGKLEEARLAFQAAINARPDFVEAHYNLSSLKTYKRDDPHLRMLEAVYANRSSLSDHARIRYCFALGKALDDTGEYDRAFAAYDEGNRLQHAILPMDEARADVMLDDIIRVFNKDFFAQRSNWRGSSDQSPIFIVGMPRSGTTLLEQILCSHPSVYGAGELIDLNAVITSLTGASTGKPFTQGVADLSEADMKRLGDEYVKRVWQLSPDSMYITDKMPANFFYLGLIHLALPNAKIIHAMRDPMDSCFSCFSRLFNDTMEFAYDQGTLGRYYVRYMKLMQHWHDVLPTGRILDLHYEDMVADTEAQARRVLEFVGLPWDSNCLAFHKNERLVKTASVAQVRKPIYKSSVARWRYFGRHLQPLLGLVQDYRTMTTEDEALLSAGPVSVSQGLLAAGMSLNAEQLHLKGIEYYRAGKFDEALIAYDQALAIHPGFASCLNSKGFVLQDLDRMEDALACFQRAIELAPEMNMARLNLGMAQLKLGDWESGWENYEARWTGSAEAGAGILQRHQCPLPIWNGEMGTQNKRLLVITEQGFGDTFQFARYLPLTARRFAKVGFACSPPTQRLMEWALGDQIITFTRMPAEHGGFDTWDMQCPLMSLPRAFGTRPDTIPASIPYLHAAEKAVQHWRERLEHEAPNRFRVGIAWAGRKAHQYDNRRSLDFDRLLTLLEDDRITWVSLQKWAPEDQRPEIPAACDWIDWTEELTDFADTAALLANLDLVISIDSSMVHLAAALGRPVWMLDRFDNEWRWLRNRADSPWYPGLRIFRQPSFGDWDSVLDAVKAELAKLPALAKSAKAKMRPVKNKASQHASNLPITSPAQTTSVGSQQALNPAQAMQLASQWQSAGRLQDAERLLRQILNTHPKHAHALHLLGIVSYQAGQTPTALQLITQALALEPSVALFHSNFAEMNRQQGLIDIAIRHGEQAVTLDPSMASAHSNLGIAYYDAKDYQRAEVCHHRALELAPQLLQSLNNLGSIERARKDLKAATVWYGKALAIQPDYLESLSNLGAVLVEDDQADAATTPLERALHIQPNYPEALCNLGLVRLKQQRTEQSVGLLRRSLQLRPGYPEALVGLARAMHELDKLDESAHLVRQAVEHAPYKVDAWILLGTVCLEQGETVEAETAYAKALEIDPEAADALAGLGNLRLEEGKIDQSVELLKRAITIDPENLGARFHLTQAVKVKPGDENLIALEAKLPEIDSMNEDKRISLHYALGKAYDDLKQYEKGFPHYLEGARLKRAKLNYSANDEAARTDRIIATVDAAFIERLRGSGDPTDVPVFVLGMPRSGTTLTEQIIASHPDVHGAGELRYLLETLQQQAVTGLIQGYPDNLVNLTPETLADWGCGYLRRLREHNVVARRITDKMPANYLALGMIPLLLPKAKIIHVKRNPIDTCISCFTRLFNKHQDATYDLYELGRHYANYARLMEHWRTVLPVGSFLEVVYEDIVTDQEVQARRLIEWIGLEWNEACLSFHKTRRNIRTASVSQVRQPIYTSSVERWRNYAYYLRPLLDGLGAFAPPE